MAKTIIINFPPLQEGILLKRYKRFLADIKLNNGEIITAHCPNTGPMSGVLNEGGRVRVRYISSVKRKLKWTWEQAEVNSFDDCKCWVGVNTTLPNRLVKLAIENGFLEEKIGQISEIHQEVKYGFQGKSRIDLLLTPKKNSADPRRIYLEVKNTTWTSGKTGLFPDTVTLRGQKHLRDLMGVVPEFRAVLVPCISRSDVDSFAPGDSADLVYGKLFRQSLDAGVEVIPCCFGFHVDHITWQGIRPFRRQQEI